MTDSKATPPAKRARLRAGPDDCGGPDPSPSGGHDAIRSDDAGDGSRCALPNAFEAFLGPAT